MGHPCPYMQFSPQFSNTHDPSMGVDFLHTIQAHIYTARKDFYARAVHMHMHMSPHAAPRRYRPS